MGIEESKREILRAEFVTKFPWANEYFDNFLNSLIDSQGEPRDKFEVSESMAKIFRVVFITQMTVKELTKIITGLIFDGEKKDQCRI